VNAYSFTSPIKAMFPYNEPVRIAVLDQPRPFAFQGLLVGLSEKRLSFVASWPLSIDTRVRIGLDSCTILCEVVSSVQRESTGHEFLSIAEITCTCTTPKPGCSLKPVCRPAQLTGRTPALP